MRDYSGRLNFIVCVISIIFILHSTGDMTSYIIVCQNSVKNIKPGKVSKLIGRAIVRKYEKKRILIDP